jgi:hypothetical protein
MKISRFTRRLALAVLTLTACAEKVTQPSGPHLDRVEGFTPGATARLVGDGLSGVNTITVAGDTVAELVVSNKEITFRVPTLRTCETDGRMVDIVANGGLTLRAPLNVPGTISMAVGESRILAEDMLTCLRLPARDEDYVLSAVRTTVPEGDIEDIKRMLFFRTWTEGTAQPVWARTSTANPFTPEVAPVFNSPPYVYAASPVPFDARYATAEQGQTVTMVNWRGTAADNATLCQQPKSQVPTFSARVVAATPRVVIAVDTRHPQAATLLDETSNGWLREAAQIVESVLLPTMRTVFDPAFQPLGGGGGRFYALLTTMGGGTGFAYDGILPGATGGSQAICPHASEMTTVRLNAAAWVQPQLRDPSRLAGLLIHEYAHNVEARVHLKAGRPSTSAWFLSEAWATVAEETAARLASSQPQGAVRSKVTAQMPHPGSLFNGLWGKHEVAGPWQMVGRYTVSAQMLMFLRELSGEVSATPATKTTFHQRLYAEPRDWTEQKSAVPVLAAAVGLTHAELVDRHALAAATAGLLPDDVIRDRNLPTFRSWNVRDLAASEGPLNPNFDGRISRTRNEYVDQWVPDGGYAAIYLMADGNKAISLAFLRTPDPSGIVRLTRLR